MRVSFIFICILSCAIAVQAQPGGHYEGILRSCGDNQPIDGARVWIVGQTDTFITVNGFYSLPLPDDSVFTIYFEADGYCDSNRTVDLGGPFENVCLLHPYFSCDVTSISAESWPGHSIEVPITLSNPAGECPLEFSITDTSVWLSASPSSGFIFEDDFWTITVLIDQSYYIPGQEYLSALFIEHQAENSPYVIPVTLVVSLNCEDTLVQPSSHRVTTFPNPFNPSTKISFTLPQQQMVELCVFDLSGRTVATMAHGILPAGDHHLTFDGTALPTGIYFARLVAGDVHHAQKLVLLK